MSFDGSVIESASLTDGGSSLRPLRGWTFHRLLEAVYSLDLNDLDWLLEGARACTCLAEKSQTVAERVILPVRSNHRDSGKDMSMIDVAGNVSKAICARMNGVSWPVVTSGGSGNQGIMVGIPVLALGTEQGLSKDQLIRALAIAHSVNILVKASIGEVSSSCGGLSAGAGLASAVCWMLGGNEAQMKEAASPVSYTHLICDTTVRFASKCMEAGADGFMYCILCASSDLLTRDEYREWGRQYDLRILDALAQMGATVFAHLHGRNLHFEDVLDYKIHVLNWHDRGTYPTLAEARKLTGVCLAGGIDQVDTLMNGTVAEVRAQAKDAVCQCGGKGLIVSSGCVVPPGCTEEKYKAVAEAVRSCKPGERFTVD